MASVMSSSFSHLLQDAGRPSQRGYCGRSGFRGSNCGLTAFKAAVVAPHIAILIALPIDLAMLVEWGTELLPLQSIGGILERVEARGGSSIGGLGATSCSSTRIDWRTVSRSNSVNPVWARANTPSTSQARAKS